MHEPFTKRRPMIDTEEFERRLRQSSGNQTNDDPLAELARVISGQKEPVQRVAGPQSQNLTEARQVATPSPQAQEIEAQEPDALQSLDDDKMACRDSGADEKIASRRSLYILIMAAIIIVGIIGASVGYRSSASPPPEIATISENGPAAESQLEKTNRSNVPTPDPSSLGAAPRPSPVTAVNNDERPVDQLQPWETVPAAEVAASPEQIETQVQPPSQTASIEPEKMNTVDQLQPRETVPAAEVAASPEQIETQVRPPSQPASIEPEKMNTASVEQHDATSRGMPPRAKPKIVPLPVPRPPALAKVPTPKTAARVTIGNTANPKRPESTIRAQPMPITSTTEKRGWVNFGTFTNGKWVEKQFEISGAPMRPPRPGDTLTATIPVNVRQGPIEDTKDFRWQNQPVACDPTNVGEKFTVMKTVEIVPGYFWAEIKSSVQCTK